MSINTSQSNCAICHLRLANKTNSHLIPSFLITMVSSVDNSYRRDKELLFTIGSYLTTAYVGHSVTDEDIKDCFESLSDERLVTMYKHTAVKDYIFCSHCEKKLGDYLESPWRNHLFDGTKIPSDSAYFFWVSLLWRISAFEGISFKLPTHIEKSLGKRLNAFIQAKDNNQNTTPLLNKAPFTYKIIYCKDYSKTNSGLIYYEYDSKSKIASIIIGDVAACFSFHKHGSYTMHSFYGLETAFEKIPSNDGYSNETIAKVDASVFDRFNINIIDKFKNTRLATNKGDIIKTWNMVMKQWNLPLPNKPSESFIRYVISKLYDDSVKIGEKITIEHYAKCFGQGLEDIYGIPISSK